MKNWQIAAVIVFVIIIGAAFYFGRSNFENGEYNSEAAVAQALKQFPTVTYSNSGFSPASMTVNAGDTVAFKNQSGGTMHITSSDYPIASPTGCGATLFDECASAAAGQTWSFTFSEKGTWHYSNGDKEGDTGTITVQ